MDDGSAELDGSVYSTTTSTFNALNQVSFLRQYQGTDQSGVYQETAMLYDGYGRLQSRHVPEQDAGTAIVYAYNADDTLHSVTDARGAAATYTYNGRHLIEKIEYAAPEGITDPADVTFGYDAAGNRTSMADGAGTTTYHYDALSRVDWEERLFAGTTGARRLAYTYNLAGGLKTITYPNGAQLGYQYDTAGAVTAVTAADFSGVDSGFASGVMYRAWGGLNEVTYGNGVREQMSYNERMLPTSYNVTGLRFSSGAAAAPSGSTYAYYPDGRLRYASDIQNNIFDRSYEYDHAGRLKAARSGSEARGGTALDGPYRQNYTYDVWGKLTGRDDLLWGQQQGDSPQYDNNNHRRQGWIYDADGRVTRDTWEHRFDAAGRDELTRKESVVAGQLSQFNYYVTKIEQTYDGDGVASNRVETKQHENETGSQPDEVTTGYFLHSSVLGGAVVAEFGTQGEKYNVYMAGRKIAAYDTAGYTEWWHANPQTGSWVEVRAGATAVAKKREVDPLGRR